MDNLRTLIYKAIDLFLHIFITEYLGGTPDLVTGTSWILLSLEDPSQLHPQYPQLPQR